MNIDQSRLNEDAAYRFEYVSEFIGFTEEDVKVIHSLAPALGPLVPGLVDAVYERLFRHPEVRAYFARPQDGYDGEMPGGDVSLDDEVIQYRKGHLARYLEALVTKPYDASMVSFLDNVGKRHTENGGSAAVAVPLVHITALMGFVGDALTATVAAAGLEHDDEIAAIRAVGKLLWIQHDLMSRHQVAEPQPA